jgi:hypothetical protein
MPPHYLLTQDALPQPPSPEIREKIPARIIVSGEAIALAKKYERVLVERAGLIEKENALAAYVDKRRDKRHSPAEIGIWPLPNFATEPFLAYRHNGRPLNDPIFRSLSLHGLHELAERNGVGYRVVLGNLVRTAAHIPNGQIVKSNAS